MIWTDGSSYQGEWNRGIQHGQGKMIFPNGTVKEGLFELNIYKGGKADPIAPIDQLQKKASNVILSPQQNQSFKQSSAG
jgi:hypothetical protein